MSKATKRPPEITRQLEMELKKALLDLKNLGVDGITIGPGDIGYTSRYYIERTPDPLTGRTTIRVKEIPLPPLATPDKKFEAPAKSSGVQGFRKCTKCGKSIIGYSSPEAFDGTPVGSIHGDEIKCRECWEEAE